MLFPTIDFAVFFGVVFLGHWLLNPHPVRWKLFMLAASYVFYGWWTTSYVWLLAASSTIAQLGALGVHHAKTERQRRWAMIGGVAGLLGLLGYFKYYDFFVQNVYNGLNRLGVHSPFPLISVLLPIGISFYTFMGISYVVDVYRREAEPAGWLDAFVYLSFFPHLVAGPIVRTNELVPQIRARRDPRNVDSSRAASLIMGGLFKKVVLSSFLATAIVDPVFRAPAQHHSLEILLAVVGYAVQIYADFSGYTDIAIGVALLLGFRFPQNFDRPYTARSLQDFWRRWHMTLSRWLRDYVYIPLGGSRGPRWTTYRNILLTMLLGGLWHGANWTFVAWGGLHGVGQCTGRWRRERRLEAGLPEMDETPGARLRQRVGTFALVCLGWVFFRADSFGTAWTLLRRLFTAWGPAPLATPLVMGAIALGIGMQYAPSDLGERVRVGFSRLSVVAQGLALGGTLFAVTTLGPQGVAPFIYFRF
ncbi:MAG: MBOAT family protein [Actinomycetota bacterium]|nr:MBOAT family protein [Actinomycetota bacterium]